MTYRRQTLALDPASMTFDSDTASLHCDASDVRLAMVLAATKWGEPGRHPEIVSVTSPRTGKVATYISASVVRLGDDATAFHYEPRNRVAAQATPGGLLIHND